MLTKVEWTGRWNARLGCLSRPPFCQEWDADRAPGQSQRPHRPTDREALRSNLGQIEVARQRQLISGDCGA